MSRPWVAAVVVVTFAGCAHTEASVPKQPRRWLTSADYFKLVRKSVMANWHAAAILRQRDPTGTLYGFGSRSTVVTVTLNPDGTLRDVQVVKSSGVDFLDDDAIEAFKRSEPFPPPTGLLTDSALKFEFEFSLEAAAGE